MSDFVVYVVASYVAEFAPDRGEQYGADREGEPVSARHAPDTGDEPA